MADTLLILALHSFRNLWLFPISMLSFSPNCWLHSWASNDLVQSFTLKLLMYAPKAGCMTYAMHGISFLNAGHSIPEASCVDCSSRVIKYFNEALSVIIPSKSPLVSSKWSSTSFKCTANLAPVCWPLTYRPQLAFERGKEQAINLIKSQLNFTQCPIPIHIQSNDQGYG